MSFNMDLSYEGIIESKIFTFVVGARKKKYNIHGAALSVLSKPLEILLNGPHKEAQELCVEWPEVDEGTFVRFIQWAYTRDYVTEEPEIVLDESNVNIDSDKPGVAEQPLYNLLSMVVIADTASDDTKRRRNPRRAPFWSCTCGIDTSTVDYLAECPNCWQTFSRKACEMCTSPTSDCPRCKPVHVPDGKRADLIKKFLDNAGTAYPTPSTVHTPRKNTECCEDYSNLFLCHAKLYVLGEIYDMPQLRQLALHRLHATLKEFTLYPSRFDDISTLTKYIFDNTPSGNKIQDMITLYYACIIEDVSKHGGLRSLIEEVPDFAHGLISRMSERLN